MKKTHTPQLSNDRGNYTVASHARLFYNTLGRLCSIQNHRRERVVAVEPCRLTQSSNRPASYFIFFSFLPTLGLLYYWIIYKAGQQQEKDRESPKDLCVCGQAGPHVCLMKSCAWELRARRVTLRIPFDPRWPLTVVARSLGSGSRRRRRHRFHHITRFNRFTLWLDIP
jgi:hypothetical protein